MNQFNCDLSENIDNSRINSRRGCHAGKWTFTKKIQCQSSKNKTRIVLEVLDQKRPGRQKELPRWALGGLGAPTLGRRQEAPGELLGLLCLYRRVFSISFFRFILAAAASPKPSSSFGGLFLAWSAPPTEGNQCHIHGQLLHIKGGYLHRSNYHLHYPYHHIHSHLTISYQSFVESPLHLWLINLYSSWCLVIYWWKIIIFILLWISLPYSIGSPWCVVSSSLVFLRIW